MINRVVTSNLATDQPLAGHQPDNSTDTTVSWSSKTKIETGYKAVTNQSPAGTSKMGTSRLLAGYWTQLSSGHLIPKSKLATKWSLAGILGLYPVTDQLIDNALF